MIIIENVKQKIVVCHYYTMKETYAIFVNQDIGIEYEL